MSQYRHAPLARAVVAGLVVIAAVSGLATSQCLAAEQTRQQLKEKFQNGDIPSEQDFADVIDSALNLVDDGFSLIGIAAASDGGAAYFGEGVTVGPGMSFGPAAGLSDTWAGLSGFMALSFSDGPETHYGYFQLSSGEPGQSDLYPMHFQYFVWEDQPNTALITSTVPEPSGVVLGAIGLLGVVGGAWLRRTRGRVQTC